MKNVKKKRKVETGSMRKTLIVDFRLVVLLILSLLVQFYACADSVVRHIIVSFKYLRTFLKNLPFIYIPFPILCEYAVVYLALISMKCQF